MKSEKGLTIHKFVVLIVVLLLFLGPTVYVIVQDNGVYDRDIKPMIQNSLDEENTIVTEDNTINKENTLIVK